MIGRSNRFHGRATIRRLYANGKSVRSSMLALRYAPNPRRNAYRLAVVVSRKISKSAVVRNRIRRRIYERVRILSGSLEACDLLVTVYDVRVATMASDELDREVAKLLHKARITSAETPGHDIVEP